MASRHAEFRRLVEQATTASERDPDAFRRDTVWLAVRGYSFVLSMLLFFVVITIGLPFLFAWFHLTAIGIKLALASLVLVVAVLRSLALPIPQPEGIALQESAVPELFAEIDRVRNSLGVKSLHRVLLVGESNASVLQRPRFGVLGGYQNYLLLGLPLMEALSVEEFRAILAHEFGHLSGQHGRSGVWLYRVRNSWAQLGERFAEGGGVGAWFFRGFANRFVPPFEAATFVLARQQEYESDAAAARIAGRDAAASGLLRLSIVEQAFARRFLKDLSKRVRSGEPVPERVMQEWEAAVRHGASTTEAQEWRDQALLQRTDVDDTHPALVDRLRALGVTPDRFSIEELRSGPETSAACILLGPQRDELTQQLSAAWCAENASSWSTAIAEHEHTTQRIRALNDLAATRLLTPAESWQLLKAGILVNGAPAMREELERFVHEHPAHFGALWQLALVRLECNEESGLATMDRVMMVAPFHANAVAHHAASWLLERGRTEEAEAFHDRADAHGALIQRAARELDDLSGKARFEATTLIELDQQALRTAISALPHVRRAWLAQRVLEAAPNVEIHVLLLESRDWNPIGRSGRDIKLFNSVRDLPSLPPQTFVLIGTSATKRMGAGVIAAAGRPLYQHG